MLDFITPSKDLFAEAKQIQDFCQITPSDNPEEISARIVDCGIYVARTSKMIADAKYHLNLRLKDEAMEVIKKILADNKWSAKVQNSLIESICKEERYLVDWLTELNKAVKYQFEAMRSLLSYEKEQMRSLAYQK